MSTANRLAAFAVGLVAAFGAAFGIGRAMGPLGGADGHDAPGTEIEGPEPSTEVPGSEHRDGTHEP